MMTDTKFFLTSADLLDIFAFIMVAWVWEKVFEYEA